jgi:hypothetical protein
MVDGVEEFDFLLRSDITCKPVFISQQLLGKQRSLTRGYS